MTCFVSAAGVRRRTQSRSFAPRSWPLDGEAVGKGFATGPTERLPEMANSLWVLIAAAGKPALLQRTLSYLAAAEKPPSYRGTLIVENGPRCGVETIVCGFAREHKFRHLYAEQANKSHALNCGLAQLDDGLVFMSDDDVRLEPHVLAA